MKERSASKPIVIILVLIIIGAFAFSLRQYRRLIRSDAISAYRERISEAVAKNRGPLGAGDVKLISPWMTFGYINLIFKLPEAYLETALSITAAKYPNVSLYRYASENKIAEADFLASVKNAVAAYFAAAPQPQ